MPDSATDVDTIQNLRRIIESKEAENKILLGKVPKRGNLVCQAFGQYEKRIKELQNENAGLRRKLAASPGDE